MYAKYVMKVLEGYQQYLDLICLLDPSLDPMRVLKAASLLTKSGVGTHEIEIIISDYVKSAQDGVRIDWEELNSECERMLEGWSRANGDRITTIDESAFEYGFELGWRIAKGEVIP